MGRKYGVEVKGVKAVLRGFKDSRHRTETGLQRDLKTAGNYLKRESQKIVPMDMGNLSRSAFVSLEGKGFTSKVSVGYSVSYALRVHEDLEMPHGQAYNQKHADDIAAKRKYRYFDEVRGVSINRTFHTRRPQERALFLSSVVEASPAEIRRILRSGKVSV